MEQETSCGRFGLEIHGGHVSSHQSVLAAQRGEGAEFHELVCSYDAIVMQVALTLTASEVAAQEIYCRVFTDAFASINQLDSSSSVFIWLYRILVRHCLEYCRRSSVDGSSFAEIDSAPRMARALIALPPTERVVFQLKQFQRLKIRTLAEIFNATPEFIIKTLLSAIERLRGQLKSVPHHLA